MLHQTTDIVVVMLHWSKEYAPLPPKGDRDIAKELSMFGVNLIIGTHPHVIQGHECVKKTMTVYSLGNFLFPKTGIPVLEDFLSTGKPTQKGVQEYIDGMRNIFNPSQLAYVFRVKLTRKGIHSAEYLPISIENNPGTNCLQPTPISSNWTPFCNKFDLYCYVFDATYAKSEEMTDEVEYQLPKRNSECILEPSGSN